MADLKTKLSSLAGTTTPSQPEPVPRLNVAETTTATTTPTTNLQSRLSSLPGTTISAAPPQSKFERFKQSLPQHLREGLFGVGQTVDITGETKFDTGLVGFLWGGLTRKDSERFNNRRARLVEEGIEPARASEVAFRSMTNDRLDLNAKEERIVRNAKLWELGEKVLDSLDFIPGLGAAIGTTGDVTKGIIKGLAKNDDTTDIAKKLQVTFKMNANDARRLAPEIANSKSEAVIASKIDAVVRGPEVVPPTRQPVTQPAAIKAIDELADPHKISPTVELPTKRVQRRADLKAETPKVLDEYYRAQQGGRRFVEIDPDNVVTAKLGADIDAFVAQSDAGYEVIEGISGQTIGQAGKNVSEAIQNAKKEIERLGPERMKQVIDEAPLSPRYTQVADTKKTPRIKGVTTADRLSSDKSAARRRQKLIVMAKRAPTVEKFVENSGITREALETTVKKQGYKNVQDFYAKNGPGRVSPKEARRIEQPRSEPQPKPDFEEGAEIQSYELLGEQQAGDAFVTAAKKEETDQMISNLEEVFAEMKGIDVDDVKLKFTEEDLFRAQQEYQFALDALLDDPARALSKYASPSTGRLPEVTGTEFIQSTTGSGKRIKNSTFGRRGDDIVTELGFDSTEEARNAYDAYVKRRQALREYHENVQDIREGIRLAKQMDQFVGSNQKALARELQRNQKALSAIVKAAERAGFRKGFKQGKKSYEVLVNNLRERRQRFSGLKWAYNLTDGEVKKLTADVDPRFMTKQEFDEFMSELDVKARDINQRRIERGIIKAVIQEKNLKNTENLREAMQLPPLSEMSLDELGRYEKILSRLEDFDEVLSKRTLEVIDRTSLKGARTVRQVRDFLAKDLEREFGKKVAVSDLENLVAKDLDQYVYDGALAEKQPFYTFLVHRTHKHLLEGEANFLRLQRRFETLVQRANKSRKKTLRQKIKEQFVPTKPQIVRFLEARGEEKELFAEALTKEEMELAEFMRNYYNSAYNYLSYINELHGSRYIDAYFTHVRKGFLEKWSDDGLIAAMKNWRDAAHEDMVIANIIDKDTGQILPKSKFFQYTLRRSGEGEVSQNVSRVFLQYARLFERKKMLDKMVPELDIYTRSLSPKETTPRGLEMNRKMQTFVNEYLNNKRGRRAKYMYVAQNGIVDMLLRGGNMMVSIMDLGLNFTAGTAAMVGEQMANYALLGKKGTFIGFKRRFWDTGAKRMFDKNANKILTENEAFLGRNIWTELAEVDQTIFDRTTKGLFGMFSQSSVEANKIYFLASLTKKELKAGKVSAERLAEMRLDAARWRDMGAQVKSIVGSTSPGQTFTKYKTWAIPILRTTAKNYVTIAKKLKNGEIKDLATSRELKEIIRQAETGALAVYLGSLIAGHDREDGFLARLKARIQQETMTLIGGLNPAFFLSVPRLISWLTTLSDNFLELATLEEYKTDSKYGDKGDLKGLGGLKQQALPAFVRQFIPDRRSTTSTATTGRREINRNRRRTNAQRQNRRTQQRRRNPNELRRRRGDQRDR